MEVTKIIVLPPTCVMNKGESVTLSAKVMPMSATNKTVRWSSSDMSVATVNFTTGVVTAKGYGTATIIATAQDGSGVTGICKISVKRYATFLKSKETENINVRSAPNTNSSVIGCVAQCQQVELITGDYNNSGNYY